MDDIYVLDPTGRDRVGEDAKLRDRGPASRVDILGVQAWSVSHPGILRDLLNDPRVSKDPRRHWPAFEQAVATWPLAIWVAVRNMFTAYGDEHRRLRRLVQGAFTARRTRAMVPAVEEITDRLLDRLARHGTGTVDLRAEFAYPLPILVICRLMGVPSELEGKMRQLVDNVFATTLSPEEQAANTTSLYTLLGELIALKRQQPGEDLITFLISERDDDNNALTDDELTDTLLLVISAGFETTVALITNALRNLLTHPGQLAAVREGRAAWTDVVEETLRRDAPVAHLPLRYAVQDIELRDGTVIARGDAILASYAAAGRHPERHGEDADAFDVLRLDKEHLAFGHGVHMCLGAPLARLEAATALERIFARYPRLSLDVAESDLVTLPSLISASPAALPARLGPPGTTG